MPQHPIRLVSQQYDLEIFNGSGEDREPEGLSDLQRMLLSNSTVSREASNKKQHFASLLDKIVKSEDKVLTAAVKIASNIDEKMYRVPTEISDNDLLGLKTFGLVQGQGRLVKLTESGKNLLRDKWLTSENKFKLERAKEKFNIFDDPKYAFRQAAENYIDQMAKNTAASVNEKARVSIAENLLNSIKQEYQAEFADEAHAYLRYLAGLDEKCPDINVSTRTLVANRFASSVQKAKRHG